jgi:hypothetical protein
MSRIITLSMVVLMTVGGTGIVLSETAREEYNHFRAEAAAALSEGKIADATNLATRAFSHMSDGVSNITFRPAHNGVVAMVTRPNQRPYQYEVQLTYSQFDEWLRDAGQYGFVMSRVPQLRGQQEGIGGEGENAFQGQKVEKYRPLLTPQQMAHPSNWNEQFEVALSHFDKDLVDVARARFHYSNEQLDWLEKAQQQREVNEINRTKALIYPVR